MCLVVACVFVDVALCTDVEGLYFREKTQIRPNQNF